MDRPSALPGAPAPVRRFLARCPDCGAQPYGSGDDLIAALADAEANHWFETGFKCAGALRLLPPEMPKLPARLHAWPAGLRPIAPPKALPRGENFVHAMSGMSMQEAIKAIEQLSEAGCITAEEMAAVWRHAREVLAPVSLPTHEDLGLRERGPTRAPAPTRAPRFGMCEAPTKAESEFFGGLL